MIEPDTIPNQPRYLTDDSVVKTDVGYEKLLFIHLNRVAQQATLCGVVPNMERSFVNSVELFDSLLEGDKDTIFVGEMNKIRDHFRQFALHNRQGGEDDEDPDLLRRYGIAWMRALMRLMKRKGYTPRVQTTDVVT